MVVRELVTVLGFNVKEGGLQKYSGGLAMVGGVATMAAAALVAAGTWFVKTAGDAEQNTIAFETMLGSAEKAKALLDEITQFAAKTPFEKTELIGYAKSMIGVGFAAADIIPTMRTLGDIAAGVGKEKLPNIVLAFNKMKSKGRASLEELWPIVEAGVPIMEQLSKDMGVNREQVMKMASAGKLSFEQVNASMNAVAQNKFGGLMDKQSRSFLGMVSNIIDSLTTFAAAIGERMLPMMKDFADKFNEVFGSGSGAAIEVVSALFQEIGMIFAYLYVLGEQVMKLFGEFGGTGTTIKTVLLFVIKLLWLNVKILIFMLTKFIQVLTFVVQGLKSFGSAAKKRFQDASKSAGESADRMRERFTKFLNFIKPFTTLIQNIFKFVWRGITAYIMMHVNFWKSIFYSIVTFLKPVSDVLSTIFNWVWDKIAGNLTDIKADFIGVGNAIKDFFIGIGNSISSVFTKVYAVINGVIDRITEFVGGKAMAAFNKVSGFFADENAKANVGATAAGVANTKSVSNTYNATPTINIQTAPGTTAEQNAAIKTQTEETARRVYEKEMRKLVSNSPSVDYTNKPAYGY